MIYKYQTFRKETFRFWKCLFSHVILEYIIDTPIVQMTNHIYLKSEGLYKSSMKQYAGIEQEISNTIYELYEDSR